MPRKKYDGVIEAVRYGSDGRIALVAAYERRGAVWSDRVMLTRPELVQRLKKGRRFAAGRRKTYLGGVFETGDKLRLAGDRILTEGQTADRDSLTGVPIF